MDTQTIPAPKIQRQILLDRWLDEVNARSMWSKAVRDDLSVECYRIAASIVIVLRYADGWDLFTSGDFIMIPSTLRDAGRRLGLVKPELPPGFKVTTEGGAVVLTSAAKSVVMEEVDVFTLPAMIDAEAAEALGLALVAAADQVRDPRNGSAGTSSVPS